LVRFNVPLDTQQVISAKNLRRQSTGTDNEKVTN